MNKKTKLYLSKAEQELKQAKEKMTSYDASSGNWQPLQFNHWKRECRELMKEVREIKTGLRSW